MEVFAVTTNNNQLIFDDEGRVLMQNNEGYIYVTRDQLPESFFEAYASDEPERQSKKLQESASTDEPVYPTSHPDLPENDHESEGKSFKRFASNDPKRVRQKSKQSASINEPIYHTTPPHLPENEQEREKQHERDHEREHEDHETQERISLEHSTVQAPRQNPARLQQDSLSQPQTDERAHWSRSHILQLIHWYKENKEIFRSNNTKNTVAWRRIANSMGSHTAKQCEAKFKYLKSLYTKKKDNMGPGSSGARAINFEYYEEFDDIFRTEPNIAPLAIASSSTLAPPAAAAARRRCRRCRGRRARRQR